MRFLCFILVLFLALPVGAATWYVRPKTGEYGKEDGTAYASAFDGTAAIVWGAGGVTAGDTLYLCGAFDRTTEGTSYVFTTGADGTAGSPITIRGDYPGDPAILYGATKILSAAYADQGDGTWLYSSSGTVVAMQIADDGTITPLAPVNSQAECAATDASYFTQASPSQHWINPIGGSMTNIYAGITWAVSNNNHSYITYRNLTCYCGYAAVIDIDHEQSGASHVTVDGCTVAYSTGSGIRCELADYVTIRNCTITQVATGLGLGGVSVSEAPDYMTVTGNNISSGALGIADYWDTGPADSSGINAQPGRGWVIEGNYIHDFRSNGIYLFKRGSATAIDAVIRYNRILNIIAGTPTGYNWGRGIAIDGTQNATYGDQWARCLVAYNVIDTVNGGAVDGNPVGAFAGGFGIRVKTVKPTLAADAIQVVGNTIANCPISIYEVVASGATSCYSTYINNLSYTPQTNGYHWFGDNVSDVSTTVLANNCFYPDTSGNNNRFVWDGVTASDFATTAKTNFVALAAADGITITNSVVADPLLADADGADDTAGNTDDRLWLLVGSPCIGVGAVQTGGTSCPLDIRSVWPTDVRSGSYTFYGAGTMPIGAFNYGNTKKIPGFIR